MEAWKLPFWALLLPLLCQESACQCSFPSSIHGTWVRGVDERVFTINANSFAGFNYYSAKKTYNSFGCHAITDNTYLLVDSQANQYTLTIQFVYLCLNVQDFGANSFIMTDLADVTAGIVKAETLPTIEKVPGVVSVDAELSFVDVCVFQLSQIESKIFHRQNVGATPGAVAALCPSNIFGNYNYTLDSTQCTGNSSLDVCTDRKTITVDYTQCGDTLAYSTGGVMDCIGHVTKGGITYFWTYNRDANVDNSSTYRTTCFAVQGSGNNFMMTYYPIDCHVGQTPAAVNSPGGALDMTALELCPIIPSSGEESVPTPIPVPVIAGGVVGGLIVIGLIVLLIVCLIRKRNKMKVASDKGREAAGKPDPKENEAVTNGHMTTHGDVTSNGLETSVVGVRTTAPVVFTTVNESTKPAPQQNPSAAKPQAVENGHVTSQAEEGKTASKEDTQDSVNETKKPEKKPKKSASFEKGKEETGNQQNPKSSASTKEKPNHPTNNAASASSKSAAVDTGTATVAAAATTPQNQHVTSQAEEGKTASKENKQESANEETKPSEKKPKKSASFETSKDENGNQQNPKSLGSINAESKQPAASLVNGNNAANASSKSAAADTGTATVAGAATTAATAANITAAAVASQTSPRPAPKTSETQLSSKGNKKSKEKDDGENKTKDKKKKKKKKDGEKGEVKKK